MGCLARILQKLERQYGKQRPPALNGPFEMVLWEQVAYLAPDDKRQAAFDELRDNVGTTPRAILAARPAALEEICRKGGGIAPNERAGRMRQSAALVLEEHGGDLTRVLRLPAPKAKRALMKFPMIGEPGAEKILLFTRTVAVPTLESNGLRVVTRLGFGSGHGSYAQAYRSARQAMCGELPEEFGPLIDAHLLLRRHGQALCSRTEPACHACPVNPSCPSFQD